MVPVLILYPDLLLFFLVMVENGYLALNQRIAFVTPFTPCMSFIHGV